jgi:acetylornithine/N-succinyldiaminopimelate aminotransferase
MGGFVRVPYNDTKAVQQAAENNRNIVAVLLEVLQGEGGIHVADPEYVRFLRKICDERGWLLMIDEVQSGIGRTGRWFAFQHADVSPDVVALAKGLGSGVPIGACLASGKAAGVFKPGNHGTTFGGGPLVSAAALTTLRVIKEDQLMKRAVEIGGGLRVGLRQALSDTAGVLEVRGMGLMIGIELDRPCGDLVKQALDAGLLINVTADRVVRLLPPLILSAAEAQQIVAILTPLIKTFLATPQAAAS